MNGNQTDEDVSPFLAPTLKTVQRDEKPNDISEPKNGLEPTEEIRTGKGGSDPFLGTIRGLGNDLSLQNNPLKQSPTTELSDCTTRVWHQRIRKASAKHYPVRRSAEPSCATALYHQSDASRSLEQSEHQSSPKAYLNLSEGVEPDDGVGSRACQDYQHQPFPDADREHFHGAARRCTKVVGKRSGLIVRGQSFYVRWKVPTRLQSIIGKTHFVRSLRTGRLSEALRQARLVGGDFERMLLKAEAGDAPLIIERRHAEANLGQAAHPVAKTIVKAEKTLEQVFEMFINDPTRKRAKKTVSGYHEAMDVIYDVIGQDTLIGDIDREVCRKLLETLQWLPTNASKRFPKLTAIAASAMAKKKRMTDTLGPVSINGYMIALSSILNFSVNEGMIGRNPSRGLRVIDPVKKRDKRLPFSCEQLRLIFTSHIYQGKSDEHRDSARFWVSLIGLFSGMRLNEICALDVADVQTIEDVPCFLVRATSDKSIKTSASERFVPVHLSLMEVGFMRFCEKRREAGCKKLFPELKPSRNDHYSVEFSKWFGRFTRKIDAHRDLTCFHSFRHNFRDGLREAKIEHELSLALGGWATSSGKTEIHANYGRGFSTKTLAEAINKVIFTDLDLSHLVQTLQ